MSNSSANAWNLPIRVSLSRGLWAPMPDKVEQILIVEAVNIGEQRVVVKQLSVSVERNQRKYSVLDMSQLSWAYSDDLPAVLLHGDASKRIQREAVIANALLEGGFTEDSKVSLKAFCADTIGGEYYSDPIVLTPRAMFQA